jgi:hypothetical protein
MSNNCQGRILGIITRNGEVIMRNINKAIALTIVLAILMVIPATVFGDIGLPVITETEVVYDSTNGPT